MKTENGIYLDLNETEYILDYYDFRYYFSSELYLNKFIKEVDNYTKQEELKFKNKYNVNIIGAPFFSLSLYKSIEKRGFKVFYKDTEIYEGTPYTLTII